METSKANFVEQYESMNAPELYEIRVAGHLSVSWAARFDGLSMRHEPEGETVLTGMLDQAAIHGIFVKIRDLGLKLVSVNRIEPTDGCHPGTSSSKI